MQPLQTLLYTQCCVVLVLIGAFVSDILSNKNEIVKEVRLVADYRLEPCQHGLRRQGAGRLSGRLDTFSSQATRVVLHKYKKKEF